MSFVDVPDLGSKITEVDHHDTQHLEICDNTGSLSFPILLTMLVLFCYQVCLAYKLADSLNRKLRILHAVFYIPISILRTLRFMIGACVITYIVTSFINNNAPAPSVENSSTNRVISTGSISCNNERTNRESEHLSEVIVIPDPNRVNYINLDELTTKTSVC